MFTDGMDSIENLITFLKEKKTPLTLENENLTPPLAPSASTPDKEQCRGRPAAVAKEKPFSMKM